MPSGFTSNVLPTWIEGPGGNVEKLKKLHAAGASFQEMADEIGGVSRNACIGKAKRLGLSRNGAVPAEPKPRKPRSDNGTVRVGRRSSRAQASIAACVVQMDPDSVEFYEMPESRRVSLLELTESNCHWPIGTPGDDDFVFCGNHSPNGVPYCMGHCRLAYRPGTARSIHVR